MTPDASQRAGAMVTIRSPDALCSCSWRSAGRHVLYFGDELALPDGHVPSERVRDVADPTRDPCRTPMPWTRQGGWNNPWLGLDDTSRNVEDQCSDPTSTLHFTRDLISLRKRLPDLRHGVYDELPTPGGTWAWRRGDHVVVAVNLDAHRAAIDGVEGTIVLSTMRGRESERVPGELRLEPAEGVVVSDLPT